MEIIIFTDLEPAAMRLHFFLLPAAIVLSATAANAEKLQPGNWEIHFETHDTEPFTGARCMTQKELDEQLAAVPYGDDQEGDYSMEGEEDGCTYQASRTGDITTVKHLCEGSMTTTKVKHDRDNYRLDVKQDDKYLLMTGKRLGDC